LLEALELYKSSAASCSDKESLSSIVQSIQAMRDDLHLVVEQTSYVQTDMKALQAAMVKNTNMLNTLLQGNQKVPMLLMVMPKERSRIGKVKALFVDKMWLYFVCPVSMQRGCPYVFSVPKGWLVKVLPVIKLSLTLLKVAAALCGLPLPALDQLVPSALIEATSSVATNSQQTIALMSELTTSLEKELHSSVSALEKLDAQDRDLLQRVTEFDSEVNTDNMPILQQNIQALSKAWSNSYQSIYDLLRDNLEKSSGGGGGGLTRNPDWRPQLTGLQLITSREDGTSAWVLNDPSVIDRFHSLGAKSLMI
jgi:hypothetical protein